MQVLVTDSTVGVGATTEQLEAAGHHVHHCHDESAEAFPCAGLGASCPLDTEPIDLVVAVRPLDDTQLGAADVGITCALRRRIPVAIADRSMTSRFEPLGAERIAGDLVGECERIAASRRPGHERVAAGAARDSLKAGGHPTVPFVVSVHRIHGRLRVRVLVPAVVPDSVRQIVAVRVVGRLRSFDSSAAGIDIGVSTLPEAGKEAG